MEVLPYLIVATIFFAINPLLGVLFYISPSIIAIILSKRNTLPILLFNILLGWFLPVWLIVFLWSIFGQRKEFDTNHVHQNAKKSLQIKLALLAVTIIGCGLIFYILTLLGLLPVN